MRPLIDPGACQTAQRQRFPRNCEKGIDILARRVYVHHKPDADGSNPRSGKPAERRWFGRKSRLSAFSFRRTPRGGAPMSWRPTPSRSSGHPRAEATVAARPVWLLTRRAHIPIGTQWSRAEDAVSCSRGAAFRVFAEKGIDIWSRRVYVHSVPEADGSNPESGRSAERRRVWGQTWSCRRSALSRDSRGRKSSPILVLRVTPESPTPGGVAGSPATHAGRAASPDDPITLVGLESGAVRAVSR